MNRYDVYILASRSGVLYIGMTSDLTTRIQQHKLKLFPGFTAQYSVSRLVWHEAFTNANEATECERRLKGWRRSKKVALIEASNPTWRDLSDDWEPTPHASGVGRFPSGGRDSQPSADSHR